MPGQDTTEQFIQSLTESQTRLYGYIYSLLGSRQAAEEVLQECNLVLWRKHTEFREGSEFIPWAFGIARFQVLAYLRDEKRRQTRFLDEDLSELLHEEVAAQAGQLEELRVALRICVGKLALSSRDLVERRYLRKLEIQAIAEETNRKLSAVKVALMRIRQRLRRCIELHLERVQAS